MSDLAPFLQMLRDQLTISEVARPHVKLTRKGRDYSGLCPFHKEKSPSFTVNDEKGFYHCFGCGAHGDIFDFVMQKQNLPFMEAVELLAQLRGVEVPKRKADAPSAAAGPKPNLSLYEVMEAACRWYEQQLKLASGAPARAYIQQRGLLPETIALFRLGYAPERGLREALSQQGFSQELMKEAGLIGQAEGRNEPYDRFRGRLMFPIWDGKGRVIAFGGRILKDGEPKYLNSPETPAFQKGKTLYAYHKALPVARQGAAFLVVEGYMDVIALHQAGLASAVAPLGTALTPDQMTLLWRAAGDPVLCFDGDAAGVRAAHRAAHRALGALKVGHTLQFCFLPGGEDPDSLVRQGRIADLKNLLSRPQPLIDVLWSVFTQGRTVSTPDQKAIARRDLGELMKDIADPDVRHFYREELIRRLQGLMASQGRDSGYSPKQQRRLNSSPSGAAPLGTVRAVPNKNHLAEKILLATLINHPTLGEEIAEPLMLLGDDGNAYEEVRQTVVSLLAENPSLSAVALQDLLRQRGFSQALAELLTPQVYALAPFARESATGEAALAGWREVWQRAVLKRRLDHETTETAAAVRASFDRQTWEHHRLQTLKKMREEEMNDGK